MFKKFKSLIRRSSKKDATTTNSSKETRNSFAVVDGERVEIKRNATLEETKKYAS